MIAMKVLRGGVLLALIGITPEAIALDAKREEAANAAVEACVEVLREAPAYPYVSSDYHLSLPGDEAHDYQDPPYGEGPDGPYVARFEIGRNADEARKYSHSFAECFNRAQGESAIGKAYVEAIGSKDGDSEAIRNLDTVREEHPNTRYYYVDVYELRYVEDLKANVRYDLLRIPPADSIEAMGHWGGATGATSECRNSYGDLCGTKYQKVDRIYQRVP